MKTEVLLRSIGKINDELIADAVQEVFDLHPKGIIDMLDLKKPVFKETAKYGHFGNPKFRWEKTDKTAAIKAAVEKRMAGAAV